MKQRDTSRQRKPSVNVSEHQEYNKMLLTTQRASQSRQSSTHRGASHQSSLESSPDRKTSRRSSKLVKKDDGIVRRQTAEAIVQNRRASKLLVKFGQKRRPSRVNLRQSLDSVSNQNSRPSSKVSHHSRKPSPQIDVSSEESKQSIVISEIEEEIVQSHCYRTVTCRFVDKILIQDPSEYGKAMNIIKVRDPINNNIIATVMNPNVKIEPFRDPKGSVIDLHQSIKDGIQNPKIAYEPNMKYREKFRGWEELLQILREKEMQQQLWQQIDRMNEIRSTFNSMIITKFQRLSRTYRKNEKVIRLFFDALIDPSDQEEPQIAEGSRDELAAAFLEKVKRLIADKEDQQTKDQQPEQAVASQEQLPKATSLQPPTTKTSLMHLANWQSMRKLKVKESSSNILSDERRREGRTDSPLSKKESCGDSLPPGLSMRNLFRQATKIPAQLQMANKLWNSSYSLSLVSPNNEAFVKEKQVDAISTKKKTVNINVPATMNKESSAGPAIKSLVPSDTLYHKDRSISCFVESSTDKHAREHGEFFQELYRQFELKLNELKREIQIQILHDKQTKGQPLEQLKSKESSSNLLQQNGDKKPKDEQGDKVEEDRVIQNLKHPSIGKLAYMGVEYKPSIRYRIHSLDYNILKIPSLDRIKPVVVSHRCNSKDLCLDEEQQSSNEPYSPKILVSPLPDRDNESNQSTGGQANNLRIKVKPVFKSKTDQGTKKVTLINTPRSNRLYTPKWSGAGSKRVSLKEQQTQRDSKPKQTNADIKNCLRNPRTPNTQKRQFLTKAKPDIQSLTQNRRLVAMKKNLYGLVQNMSRSVQQQASHNNAISKDFEVDLDPYNAAMFDSPVSSNSSVTQPVTDRTQAKRGSNTRSDSMKKAIEVDRARLEQQLVQETEMLNNHLKVQKEFEIMEQNQDAQFRQLKRRHWRVQTLNGNKGHMTRNRGREQASAHANQQLMKFLDEAPQIQHHLQYNSIPNLRTLSENKAKRNIQYESDQSFFVKTSTELDKSKTFTDQRQAANVNTEQQSRQANTHYGSLFTRKRITDVISEDEKPLRTNSGRVLKKHNELRSSYSHTLGAFKAQLEVINQVTKDGLVSHRGQTHRDVEQPNQTSARKLKQVYKPMRLSTTSGPSCTTVATARSGHSAQFKSLQWQK